MSKITLTPHASGTGTLNIAAPNTNSTRTLTLPDADLNLGNVLTTASSVDAANLTGALPAIDGAALTGIATGMTQTLLGTLATTSGTTVTLSGLTLTSYKQLQCIFEGVSGSSIEAVHIVINGVNFALASFSNLYWCTGGGQIDLATGVFWCSVGVYDASSQNAFNRGYGGQSGLSTASTSISFSISAGNFDAGSIKIYGVA